MKKRKKKEEEKNSFLFKNFNSSKNIAVNN